MGVVGSKSHLERRNTVLRRSQRKSVHGAKSKAEKLIKDIRKFKGTEENSDYTSLKDRIDTIERELKTQTKNLQPQVRAIYNEALKKAQECHKLLDDKLADNQEKLRVAEAKKSAEKKEEPVEEKEEEVDDDVFIQEIMNDKELDDSTDKRKTVELKVIQVESIESSPQINKRFSAMKIGVPVMPGSMMESLHRRTESLNARVEERVSQIRKSIEGLEIEISRFVGRKNGKYYNKIKEHLDNYNDELAQLSSVDDEVSEEIKRCSQYIGSCLSFLNEKAVDGDVDSDDDDRDYDEVAEMTQPRSEVVAESNLSPRSIRTTYI